MKVCPESKYLSKPTLCTICHPSGFNKAGKSFSEGCLWSLMSESSTHNQQLCRLGSVGWRQKAELNEMEPNFSGQYEHRMLTHPCPIPCLGKSALCIQPSYWDHTMLHVSLIQSLFFWQPIYTVDVTQFYKVFNRVLVLEGHQNASASRSSMVIHSHGTW